MATVSVSASAASYARLSYEVASSSDGGATSASVWETRPLNTEIDTDAIVSLSANQMTFVAGTYDCLVTACLVNVQRGKLRLRNITDSLDVVLGQNTYTSGAGNGYYSSLCQRFTIAAGKALELQSAGAIAQTFGMGYHNTFGNSEVYTVAEFWKVA